MLTPTPKKLQDAFLKLIDNKELREKYGAALHNSVDENFSIDRMVEQTLKQY
jgi:glycosyltransferase involved in cell wall biosynthesis